MKGKKSLLYSIIIGLTLTHIGVIIMGYLAAIAVPKEFFFGFSNPKSGLVFLDVVTHFLAFGLLAVTAGFVIGKISHQHCLRDILACYASVLIYFSIGVSIIYDVSIMMPYQMAAYSYYIPPFIIPICLICGTHLSGNGVLRFNR